MRYVSTFVRSFALFSFAALLISCQKRLDLEAGLPTPSEYDVHLIDDGVEFSGVVMVVSPSGSLCSGTIVSHKAVLTAAHCTLSEGTYSVRGKFRESDSNAVVSTLVRDNFGPGVVDDPNDLSVLVFPENTFQPEHIFKIGSSVRTGDIATLVGYGCNNLSTSRGSGVKRMGTNQVANLNEYVEFYTPATSSNYRGIIGPENRAGSCPGDSGGPAFKEVNGNYEIVAVTHAGGVWGRTIISQYVDLTRNDNRGFISRVNSEYDLGIQGF